MESGRRAKQEQRLQMYHGEAESNNVEKWDPMQTRCRIILSPRRDEGRVEVRGSLY